MKYLILILIFSPFTAFAQMDLSWTEIANNFYKNKEYKQSISYYEKWLEASPKDSNSWYNLACCYSLNNQKTESINALRNALKFGFDNCSHIEKDSDLTNISDHNEFNSIVEGCYKKAANLKVQHYEVEHTLMESLGTYGVLLPNNYDKGKEYQLVVWLHGNGSNEQKQAKLVSEYELENVICIFPRAPYVNKAVTEYNGKLGWTTNQTDNLAKSDDLYQVQGLLFLDWISKCIDDAKLKYSINKEKCLMFGHSQGAAYSLAFPMVYPDKVKLSIAFGGGVTSKFPITKKEMETLEANDTDIVIIHGNEDKLVKLKNSESLVATFIVNKVNANLIQVESGHSINKNVMKEIINLIDKYKQKKE